MSVSSSGFMIHAYANESIEISHTFDEGYLINLHSIVMSNIESILSIEISYEKNGDVITWDIHAPILFSACTQHSNSLIFPPSMFFKNPNNSYDLHATNFDSPIFVKVNTIDHLTDKPHVPIKLRIIEYKLWTPPPSIQEPRRIYKYNTLYIPHKPDDAASIDRCVDVDLLQENLGEIIGFYIVNWKHVRNLHLLLKTSVANSTEFVCIDYNNDDIRDFGHFGNHPDVIFLPMGVTQCIESTLDLSDDYFNKCMLNVVFNDFTDPDKDIYQKVEIIALSICDI